jgi:hypothetical protein
MCKRSVLFSFTSAYMPEDDDNGPDIILVCPKPEQMDIINKKILRHVRPIVYVNLDMARAQLMIYAVTTREKGFSLTTEDIQLLVSMNDAVYQPHDFRASQAKVAKVIFGFTMALDDDLRKKFISGLSAYQRFSMCVGSCKECDGQKRYFLARDYQVIYFGGPEERDRCSTDPSDQFLDRMRHSLQLA